MISLGRIGAVILAALAVQVAGPQASRGETPEDETFERIVRPFLSQHCVTCHGERKAKSGLRLDRMGQGGDDTRVWTRVFEQLRSGEMPPAGEPRPTEDRLRAVRAWLSEALGRAERQARSAGRRVVLRRLNRNEYDGTIRDLFGVDFKFASRFPEDDTAHGFDTIGQALSFSPLLLEKYLQAAETVVSRVITSKKPEVFKRRWTGTELAYNDSLKHLEAVGRKPEGGAALIFQSGPSSCGGHNVSTYGIPWGLPRWKAKVPGEYVFRVKASFIGFGASERLRGKIYYEPKHLVGFPEGTMRPILRVTKDGELVGRLHVTRTPEEYELRAYFEAGQSFEYSFENGAPNVNLGRPEVARDYPGPGLLVQWIEIEGPVFDAWPTQAYRDLFFRDGTAVTDREGARRILEKFAARAYRRPARAEETENLLRAFDVGQRAGRTFEESIGGAIQLALSSPGFLYVAEPERGGASETARRLDGHELATRLSYFLWSTMPDETLLRKAGDGSFLPGFEEEARRMLADPRSAALTRNFAAQWLHLSKLDAVAVDSHLLPFYTDYLRTLFRRETEAFFEEILHRDLSILNFLDSDFVMVNDRLAVHYGIPDVTGPEFRRVPVAKELHRGGLLGQAGILTLTTCGTQTSPVLRGRWVLDCLLGSPPPPPPKDVPALTPDTKGTRTTRERLAKHREDPSCASCHDRIDPLGLALENFGVGGLWRSDYGKPPSGGKAPLPIDAAAVLPTGESFDGPEGLKGVLLKKKDRFVRALTEKVLIYALGRSLDIGDRGAVDEIVAGVERDGYRMSSLILGIVRSEPFRTR